MLLRVRGESQADHDKAHLDVVELFGFARHAKGLEAYLDYLAEHGKKIMERLKR